LLYTLATFEEMFPRKSNLWWMAANCLALENVSNQLAILHMYDNELMHRDRKAVRRMRLEQIEDLETIHNLHTTDYFFKTKIEKIIGLLGIDKDYEKIQEKLGNLSSDVLIEQETELLIKETKLLENEQASLDKQGELLGDLTDLAKKQDKLANILRWLTIGLLSDTVLMGAAVITGLGTISLTISLIFSAILVTALVLVEAQKVTENSDGERAGAAHP
jgi:23S rRNA maturation mini-RNase III